MDIGIIGGSDGPTTIFVTSDFNWTTITIMAVICIAVVGVIIWSKRRRKRNGVS